MHKNYVEKKSYMRLVLMNILSWAFYKTYANSQTKIYM